MDHHELNLLNNAIYVTPHESRDCKFCPREEIAHPEKLALLVNNQNLQWDIYQKGTNTFFMTVIPWYRVYQCYGQYIYTSHFYVLTEKTSMFSSLYIILQLDTTSVEYYDQLYNWVINWWNTSFLISIPILHCNSGPFIINNTFPPERITLCDCLQQDYCEKLLDHQSYTIANGMTLILGLHRIKRISAYILKPLLDNFMKIESPFIYQDVSDTWSQLYYASSISQIADFPWYYTCMGPQFAHENIVEIFRPENIEDYDTHLFISQNQFVFTSPQCAMFPFFNPCLWERHNEMLPWLDPSNIDSENGDILYPDIAGCIHGILTTKGSWRWWKKNNFEMLTQIKNAYISQEKCIEDLLQVCSHYYWFGSPYTHKYYRKKIRYIWNCIIRVIDMNLSLIPRMIGRFIIKEHLCQKFILDGQPNQLWVNPMPFSMCKDFLRIYNSKISLYNTINFSIITNHSEILKRLFPDSHSIEQKLRIVYENQQEPTIIKVPSAVFNRSLITLFKYSFPDSALQTFYRFYIDKTIVTRLSIIYFTFGLKNYSTTQFYTVGEIIIEFLKKNKDYLIL
jgi:hypothetical protein